MYQIHPKLKGFYWKGQTFESLKAAEAEFERFKQAWSQYPGAIDVWVRNWKYVERLFNYGSAVRKAFYLRITELYKKWNGRPISNWAMVRNQLSMDDKIQSRILKYENY